MLAAGIRALFVNRATPCGAIQIKTITAGMLCQRENAVARVEVRNNALLGQSFGNVFERLIAFKVIG